MIDLSKAFACLSHELLIAKLKLRTGLIKNLYNWSTKSKNKWLIQLLEGKIVGVSQDSILASLLFNIFICDIFYFLEDYGITNY